MKSKSIRTFAIDLNSVIASPAKRGEAIQSAYKIASSPVGTRNDAIAKVLSIFLLIICFISLPISSWAGGAVAAIKQREIMEQRAIQEELVRRQQAAMIQQYMVAYQQAAVQQYVQAQKQAIAMRAAQEQAVAQHMAQQMVQEIAAYQMAAARREQLLAQETMLQIRVVQNMQYQQALMARQAQQYNQQAAAVQMIAAVQQQKTLAEYQQALLAKEMGERAAYEQVQQARGVMAARDAQEIMLYQAASAMNQDKLYENIPSNYVKEVVPVSDLWKSLDKSSKAWPLIIDNKAKGVTISHYIQRLANEGAIVRKDPKHYIDMIEGLAKENPTMLLQPFMEVLRIMAIIEYDYDNGVDRDALARRVFPDEKSFKANKQRLGL